MTVKRLAKYVAGATAVAAVAAISAAPAGARELWVIIVYSPATGAIGWDGFAPSYDEGMTAARGMCVERGGTDCQSAAWTPHGCAALAVAWYGAWHGGVGKTKEEAEWNALWGAWFGEIKVSECAIA